MVGHLDHVRFCQWFFKPSLVFGRSGGDDLPLPVHQHPADGKTPVAKQTGVRPIQKGNEDIDIMQTFRTNNRAEWRQGTTATKFENIIPQNLKTNYRKN